MRGSGIAGLRGKNDDSVRAQDELLRIGSLSRRWKWRPETESIWFVFCLEKNGAGIGGRLGRLSPGDQTDAGSEGGIDFVREEQETLEKLLSSMLVLINCGCTNTMVLLR